jgi:hypothetical protein
MLLFLFLNLSDKRPLNEMRFFQEDQRINERCEINGDGALIFYIPDSVIIPAPLDSELAVEVPINVGLCD